MEFSAVGLHAAACLDESVSSARVASGTRSSGPYRSHYGAGTNACVEGRLKRPVYGGHALLEA